MLDSSKFVNCSTLENSTRARCVRPTICRNKVLDVIYSHHKFYVDRTNRKKIRALKKNFLSKKCHFWAVIIYISKRTTFTWYDLGWDKNSHSQHSHAKVFWWHKICLQLNIMPNQRFPCALLNAPPKKKRVFFFFFFGGGVWKNKLLSWLL